MQNCVSIQTRTSLEKSDGSWLRTLSSRYELAELKHGRLAMIGMASVFSAIALPGSVPALSGIYPA